ncbi:MAG: hypothetical protein GY757_32745 [bacterium]|nr:hypothetical protein [bacterium]
MKISSYPSLPNIKAANEAFYHLLECGDHEGISNLSDKLLNKNVVPHLDVISRQMDNNHKYKENKRILELITRLAPEAAKYHRFLGEVIERLEGKGGDEALKCYKEAFKLSPGFPANLTDLGRCLLARRQPEVFIEKVENLKPSVYRKIMDNHNIAIYTGCLEQAGREEEASKLRTAQLDAGSRVPVFYNDEANYLLKKADYQGALAIIKRAESSGCANEYSLSVKATALEKSGCEAEASGLRMVQIEAGARNPAFYTDEANYLYSKQRYDKALLILKKAVEQKCEDEYTQTMKAKIEKAKSN